MFMPMIQQMREELTRNGFTELKSTNEVEQALPNAKGTSLVFVNSVCGCAGGIARPGAVYGLQNGARFDNLYTVFAGQDKEATAKAREYFAPHPPSSPSMAVLKDGKVVAMIPRHEIEGSSPQAVAQRVIQAANAAAQA